MASITVTAPSADARVTGKVDVRVRVDGGTDVSAVNVVIGYALEGTREAKHAGGLDYVYTWNTERRLDDPGKKAVGDAMYWISASAVVDGVRVDAPHVPVITNNVSGPAKRREGGWRPELAWQADYSGSLELWQDSHSAIIGADYASLQDDPVLGPARRAVHVSVPNSAKDDADQPTDTTVRFQSSSVQNIGEGDEFCVGFAFLPPPDFPSVFPDGDVTNPATRPTSYIAIFQFYGPPYEHGAPLVLHTSRRTPDDPLDEFTVKGNSLNPGDAVPLLSLPYNRGRWTDVVFRIRASASIERGWVEMYVNQGESAAVRPLPVFGRLRIPRVLLRGNSEPFRTDMQIYRVKNRFEQVSMWHTGHKIAATVEEADPRSYRNGGLA